MADSRLRLLNRRCSPNIHRLFHKRGPLHFQNRGIFDYLFAKGIASGLLNRIAVEYAYSKYIGVVGHIRSWIGGGSKHKDLINHSAIPLLRRSHSRLIPLDDSIRRLQHQYKLLSQQPEAGDIALIVNIGRKKQGKSLNATMASIMLSDDGGCAFPIHINTNYDFPTTAGCDISPPLPVTVPLPHSYHIATRFDIGNIKHFCFLDIEGVNLKEIDHPLDVLHFISRTFLHRVPCILMLSSLLSIDESDIMILEKLCNEQTGPVPVILALSTPSLEEIKQSVHYATMQEIENIGRLKLCKLPHFDESRKEQANKFRVQSMNGIHQTPLKDMTHREKTEYFMLSLRILELVTECNADGDYRGVSSNKMLQILQAVTGQFEGRSVKENFS